MTNLSFHNGQPNIGPLRLAWNGVSLFLIAYDLFIVPMQAFEIDYQPALIAFEWIVTLPELTLSVSKSLSLSCFAH